MEGKARELLKAVYLKPLRDAAREMSSGRNSRISQILMSYPVFSDRDGHRLKEILSNANNDIEKYFIEEDGKVILQTIRNTLSVLNSQDISDEAKLETSDIQLKAILESLSLSAPEMIETSELNFSGKCPQRQGNIATPKLIQCGIAEKPENKAFQRFRDFIFFAF